MNYIDFIANFKNRFDYVEDFEAVIMYLDQMNIPLTQINEILHKILEWNIEKENEIKKELLTDKEPIKKEITNEEERKDQEKEKQPETERINYYKKLIENCEDQDFITEILPSTNNEHFEEIIYSILLSFYKELVCANQMLKLETDPYLLEERKNLQNIINIIKEYYKEETTPEPIEQQKKASTKIIYMTNQQNIPYINIDLEGIDSSDIKDIVSVINNLKDGSTKHEKKFTNHEDLKGISAIRKKDIRVIFTRIDDTIIILGVFAKRFQNPTIYRELLKRRNKIFKNQKDEMKENIKNKDYLNENKKITEKITRDQQKKKTKRGI